MSVFGYHQLLQNRLKHIRIFLFPLLIEAFEEPKCIVDEELFYKLDA
jgi:hypothetical protein